jgi:copper chaperone NosL
MTIVDKQHAAEVVTSKGKIYKFDAIECMVRFRKATSATKFAHEVVNDFEKPGELIPAAGAGFLISPAIPSPMGANLTAFENLAKAQNMQKSKGGEAMSWEELNKRLQ